MTYEEIVGYVKEKADKADAKKYDQVAVQIDITGEGEGAFYVAVKEGKLEVAPYEYYGHNAKVVADGADFIAFLDGAKDAEVLTVYGEESAADIVKNLAAKAPAKTAKAPAKKASAKAEKAEEPAKEPAKKASKTVKAEAKKENKKEESAKAEEKKAEPAKKAAKGTAKEAAAKAPAKKTTKKK